MDLEDEDETGNHLWAFLAGEELVQRSCGRLA